MAKAILVKADGYTASIEFTLNDDAALIDKIYENIPSAAVLDWGSFIVKDEDGVPHRGMVWFDDLGIDKQLPLNDVASSFAKSVIYGDAVITETIGDDTVGVSAPVILALQSAMITVFSTKFQENL